MTSIDTTRMFSNVLNTLDLFYVKFRVVLCFVLSLFFQSVEFGNDKYFFPIIIYWLSDRSTVFDWNVVIQFADSDKFRVE